MKNTTYPPKMLKSRTKTWLNARLPELLKQIPSRHRKVLAKIKLTNIQWPLHPTYLCGKVRTGKTIQAWQIALQWHKEQYIRRLSTDFIFTSNVEMLADLRSSYRTNEVTEEQILEKYKKVKLLVIDDFGTEKITEWAHQMLYMILSYRYDNEKITVYTSNLTPTELAKKLDDDRMVSRISHECKGNIITFTNKPYI